MLAAVEILSTGFQFDKMTCSFFLSQRAAKDVQGLHLRPFLENSACSGQVKFVKAAISCWKIQSIEERKFDSFNIQYAFKIYKNGGFIRNILFCSILLIWSKVRTKYIQHFPSVLQKEVSCAAKSAFFLFFLRGITLKKQNG